MRDPAKFYDECYERNYREHLSGFEVARWQALHHFITRVLGIRSPERVLDYGAGSGLHVPLWQQVFPAAELHFCDISRVALQKLAEKHPLYAGRCHRLEANRATLPDAAFDVIVSVEVMEHVEHLLSYVQDVRRLLRPGGHFIWTTPCANPLSVEHVYAVMTGRIQPTSEGYRRWEWEDPGHVRRLRSREIRSLLETEGFTDTVFRFRAHLFSFVCTQVFPSKRLSRLSERMMTLDYRLFRRLSNGASMLGSARKLPC